MIYSALANFFHDFDRAEFLFRGRIRPTVERERVKRFAAEERAVKCAKSERTRNR